MNFEFGTSQKIIFGPGSINKIGSIAIQSGSKALLITGSGKTDRRLVIEILENTGMDYSTFSVSSEPEISVIENGFRIAKENHCDFVIGFGGGSVIDSAKAIAAMMTNGGKVTDYLEVVGQGKQPERPSAPMIAIPTTAGTGSEVTKNSVITSLDHKIKVSMRGTGMIPRVALVDPEVTLSMPPNLTAYTGIDALTQLTESLISNAANPMTDALSKEGIRYAARNIRAAFQDGSNLSFREGMCIASLFGGLSLANGGLGAVHGFAGVLGGLYNLPHGAVCGCLLPAVLEANYIAVKHSEAHISIMEKLQFMSRTLVGKDKVSVSDGIGWIKDTTRMLKIPKLSEFGVTPDQYDEIIKLAQNSSSMKKNPIKLSYDVLMGILQNS